MQKYEKASLKTSTSLALLNFGQNAIFSVALSGIMVMAAREIINGGMTVGDLDLVEINEAFAVVAMIAMRDLGLSHEIVNVNGGACALGHPIGASGARILVTLISALEQRGLKRGMASLCIGGGEATAVGIELI